MKDSGRLTARETSELEHRLLEAARKARIPPEMTLRMSQGLGFGAKAAGASAAAVAVGLKTGGLVVLGAVAIIGVAGSIAGWFGHGGGTSDGVAPAAETAAAAPPVTAAPPIAVAPVAATPRGTSDVRRAPSRGPAPRPPPDGVREELALLEAARSALAAGAPIAHCSCSPGTTAAIATEASVPRPPCCESKRSPAAARPGQPARSPPVSWPSTPIARSPSVSHAWPRRAAERFW